MDARTGKGKVIAEAAAAAGKPAVPVQLGLLGDGGATEVEPAGERRGPGRRPGAENLATREIRRFIGANFRHPLVTLARIQAQDPVALARALGCKPVEALDRIKSAADMLAPYLAGKMPVEDANGNAVLPVIQLVDPSAFRAVAEAADVLDLRAIEVLENQGLGDDGAAGVGQSESDGSAESQAKRGVQPAGHVIGDHGGEAGR